MEKPSVGRIVHYVAYGTPGGEFPAGVCRAAIITEVPQPGPLPQRNGVNVMEDPELVGLCIVNPTGLFFNRNLVHDEAKAPGTWHWCERV